MQAIAEAHEVNAGHGHSGHKCLMDFAERFVARLAQREVRLVRNENEGIACILQLSQGRNHTVDQMKVGGVKRRLEPAGCGIRDHCVEDAVAIEENRRAAHCADSHFISLARIRGWETMRCQTTAWNSSVWGVTVSGERVGMIRQASAT